jgi:integrase
LAGGSLVEYVTTGKGGLSRSIMLSFETSKLLERHRLVEPVYIKDRGVRYEKSYSPAGVSGGAAWSTSFSRASVAALGWSCGGHSLRHTFVENRMITLTEQLNYEYHDAKLLISQELGHFREDILIYYGYP